MSSIAGVPNTLMILFFISTSIAIAVLAIHEILRAKSRKPVHRVVGKQYGLSKLKAPINDNRRQRLWKKK
jgi:hypothetical protein